MSSHGYLTMLERERDELERRYRLARTVAVVAIGYGVALSLVIAVVWLLALFTEALA